MSTNFTVLSASDDVIATGQKLEAAVDLILTSDNYEWKVERDENGYMVVYQRGPWVARAQSGLADDASAQRDALKKIIRDRRRCETWAMTDDEYGPHADEAPPDPDTST